MYKKTYRLLPTLRFLHVTLSITYKTIHKKQQSQHSNFKENKYLHKKEIYVIRRYLKCYKRNSIHRRTY